MRARMVANCIAGFLFAIEMYVCLLHWPAHWSEFHVRQRIHDSVAKGDEVIGNIFHAN